MAPGDGPEFEAPHPGRISPVDGDCGVISPLSSQGLEVDPVATCVVGVDASPGTLWALTWARLWLASLQVVHP